MTLAPSVHLLRTLAAVPVSSRILDLGCGEARHLVPLIRLGFDVFACDASPVLVGACRSAVTPHLGDADATRRITAADPAALGYPDEYFHWVLSYRTFRSGATPVVEILDALYEVRRVLMSGGWLYLAIETPESDRSSEELTLGLYRLMEQARFELAERAEVIEEEGCRIVRGIFRRVDAGTPL